MISRGVARPSSYSCRRIYFKTLFFAGEHSTRMAFMAHTDAAHTHALVLLAHNKTRFTNRNIKRNLVPYSSPFETKIAFRSQFQLIRFHSMHDMYHIVLYRSSCAKRVINRPCAEKDDAEEAFQM